MPVRPQGERVTEEASPSVDDPLGSPDRPKAAQEAAWAQVRARYAEAQRPPLTAAERREREGFSTLPMTDEIRTTLHEIPRAALGRFYGSFLVVVFVVMFGEIIVPLLVAKKGASVSLSTPALSLVVMVAGCAILVRWRRLRHIAQVNRLQTYSRYAGPCEIKEIVVYGMQGSRKYMYDLLLASPPAPSTGAVQRLRLDDFLQHAWLVAAQWCTVEFVGKTILSIRDDRDKVLFQYPNQFPGEI